MLEREERFRTTAHEILASQLPGDITEEELTMMAFVLAALTREEPTK